MNEFMPYLGWLLCGFITGAAAGVGSMVLFMLYAVWFAQRVEKKEQEEALEHQDGVQEQDPPYYQPN